MSELNNARYEAFAQGIAEGKTQKDAYKAAFPRCNTWKDRTIINRACELAKNEDIAERVNELKQSATSEKVINITRRKEILSQIAENVLEKSMSRIKAIDTLNEMEGVYTNNISISGNINNPFEGLTTDELRKLARDG